MFNPINPVRLAVLVLTLASLPVPSPAAPSVDELRRDATVLAVERVMPCVVNIATASVVEYEDFYQRLFRDFFGQGGYRPRQQEEYSIGSGVIIDEDGYVLTNLHVVRRATRTQIKLWDGREYEADQIVATPNSDVALLKIRCKPGERFKAVSFAADDDLLLGETVLALGNPFGLGGSVTKGILSSKTRRPATGNEPLNVNNWLQTDAAINPGNSGGPLIDIRGELIGLNVAVYREGQGIGFAIPVKQVSEALAGFFSPEVSHSLWFGARVRQGPPPVVISTVQPGSPADTAGLRDGDKILQVNGQPTTGLIDFNRKACSAPSRKLTLLIEHPAEQPAPRVVTMIPYAEMIHDKIGLSLRELNEQDPANTGFQQGKGLLVVGVQKGSPAERAQLQPGLLVTAADGNDTGDLMSAGNVLSGKRSGDRVTINVIVPRRLGNSFVQFSEARVNLRVR
jgi:S1-C subfamily serine protease